MKHGMLMNSGPAILEFYFTENKTGEVIKDYKVMHGKLMHMVIVKKDLSFFKHIHPYFDPITGRFQITLNMKHQDPDNFGAENVFDGPGMYMVMVDIEPKGIGMRMFHHHLHLHGKAIYKDLELIDNKGNEITKTFYKEKFKAHFDYNVTPGCHSNLIEVNLNIKVLNELTNTYESKTALFEDWLMTGAHALWISQKSSMSMAHMHAARPPKENTPFVFSYFDNNHLAHGIQKIWFQMKFQGKVYTFPFVFEYAPLKVSCD